MTTFAYEVRFTDTYLAAQMYGTRPCLVCFREADIERGWVKSQDAPESETTWWLCNDCLDREPSLTWDGAKPRAVRFR